MSYFQSRDVVDDSNFIFLNSGVYPQEYIGLEPGVIYPYYYLDKIKPWKDKGNYSNSRFDNYNLGVNIDCYPIQEYWEPIPDSLRAFGNAYANIPPNIYVSSFGRIYDFETKTAIPCYMRKDGYLGVFNMMALHRIILYTFLPIPDFLNMTVDHKNLNTTDNCLWNLQWMSMYDNIKKSVDSGNRTNPYFQKGEANIFATMSDWEAELCCRALLSHKYSYSQIAFAVGVTVRQVKHIKDCDCRLDICNKYNMQANNFDYRHLAKNNDRIVPLLCESIECNEQG